MGLLSQVAAKLTEQEVKTLRHRPPLFASETTPNRLSSTILIVLSVLVAALSGLASNILSGLLLPSDLSNTARLIISGSVFALTLIVMIWLALRHRDAMLT